MIQEWNSQPKG